MTTITRVDGTNPVMAKIIHDMNQLYRGFPPLTDSHLRDGHWWIAWGDGHCPVAFAGMVPFKPVATYGYFKRCYVMPTYRGHGLQSALMAKRLHHARRLDQWTHIVSDCAISNHPSASNFFKAGFELTEPEQPWCKDPSLYFIRELGRAVA